VRPEGRRGRSLVVFAPTDEAQAFLAEMSGGSLDDEQWEKVRASILEALEEGKGGDYRRMLNDILRRIPERRSPLLFAADMITAIILVFYDLRDAAAAKRVFAGLRLFGPPGWAVLYSLAGFSLALSLVEKANRKATSLLLAQAEQFREHLDNLTGGEKARLSEFVYEVLRALGL
jgi:hypothetical protein